VRFSPFVLRRLHALSGVFPLSVFFVEHIWTNAAALGGRAPFQAAVDTLLRLPGLWALETFGIFLPLAFHAFYGIFIARTASVNVTAYPTSRNWAYVLQRVSGGIIFLFLAVHLYELRIAKALGTLSPSDFYDTLASSLGTLSFGIPVRALGYLLGLAATAFHFGNGLVGFAQSFGIATTQTALRRVAWLGFSLATVLFLLGAVTVLHLATGL
jgi:succinate dehydrogenase / fumarate reductase cytochrome b subunit